MTFSPTTAPTSQSSDDIDLKQVLTVLRRRWVPVVLAPLLLGAGTYVLLNRQPRTYEASTSLMSSVPDNSNSVVNGASVTAAQLPQGAVDEVIHSRGTVDRIKALVRASDLPPSITARISISLDNELSNEKYSRVVVKSRLDQQQRGVYDLRSSAESPEAARVLAAAAAQALLEWDIRRARNGVSQARQNLQRQYDNLTASLSSTQAGSVEQQSLIAARGQLILDLSQATVFEAGARGNLTLLAEANAPRNAVAPKPLRNAALVAALTLFAGIGLTLLLDSLGRKVRSMADVIGLDVTVIGELPRLRRLARADTVQAAQNGALYEPAGFIRVNLGTALKKTPSIITVSSARPGEGKSSTVAVIGTAFAQTNQRVLIIDLDLHRPKQQDFWPVATRPWVALPGATEEATRTTVTRAMKDPQIASAVDVGGGVHVLPAGEGIRRATGLLSDPALPGLLQQWAQGYDVVLIDTPPVLSVADAFMIAQHTDGMLLVIDSDGTSVSELQRVLRDVRTSGTNVIGVVVNKVRRSEQGYYYSYQYTSDTKLERTN
ncbi:AAA family ATPase [Deinococcus sp. UYEF24]